MLAPVLTDLSYLLVAAFPSLARLATPFARWRYRGLARHYETRAVGRGYSDSLQAALARIDTVPSRVGDVAAGTGVASRLLRLRFPHAQMVAIDLSVMMLRKFTAAETVERVAGNGWALPLRSGSLDLAVVHNAPPCFSELLRVIRPGGFVLFGLSAGGRIPHRLRGWLLRRAVSTPGPALEVLAGSGVTWLVRKEDVHGKTTADKSIGAGEELVRPNKTGQQ